VGTIKGRRVGLLLVFAILVATVCSPINIAHAQVQNISVTKLVDDPYYKETLFVITTDENTYHVIVRANITKAGNETLIDLEATLYNPHNTTFTASAAIPDTLTDHPYVGTVEAIRLHFPEEVVEYLVYWILPIAIIATIIIQVYMILEDISSYLLNVLLNEAPFVWASIPYVLYTLLRNDSNNDDTGTHTPYGYPPDDYHLGSFDFYIPYSPFWYHVGLVFDHHYYVATAKNWWEINEHEVYTDVWTPWGTYRIVWFTYYTANWIRSRALPPVKIPPSASFYWRPIQPIVGERVVFTSTSFDSDGSIVTSHWWLGDGSEEASLNLTHIYANIGNYSVTLEVVDNDGLKDNITQTVSVKPLEEARLRVVPDHLEVHIPSGQHRSAEFVAGESLNQTDLLEVVFSTTDFKNPENDTISAGTVTFDKNGISIIRGTYTNVTATFYSPPGSPLGWYNGNISISSGNGGKASVFVGISIFGPPTADFTWNPVVPKVGELVNFDASLSMPSGGPISQYRWDFGDGQTATGKTVSHAFSSATTYSITLNITDSEGLWDVEQKQLQVVQPYGPKAEFAIVPETANIGQLVKFDASASQQGWNGTNQMPIIEYRWDFGDGNKTTVPAPTIYHTFGSSGIYYPTLTVYASGATPETDAITHRVVVMSVPVGGYSVSLTRYSTLMPSSVYLALLIMLSAVFTTVRRKIRGKK